MTNASDRPDPLETDFAALKAQASPPGDDLMARVMADAAAEQAAFMAPPVAARPPARVRFMELIGGWPSMAGLATAGIAGVWIGMAQPALLVSGSEALFSGDVGSALNELDTGFGLSVLDGAL
ncbi:MAG: dihydroorotate dehydrogenase [Pseudomonadota bacterium]